MLGAGMSLVWVAPGMLVRSSFHELFLARVVNVPRPCEGNGSDQAMSPASKKWRQNAHIISHGVTGTLTESVPVVAAGWGLLIST